MDATVSFLGERPPGVSPVAWDLVKLLRTDLEGMSAVRSYKRDAAAAADPAAEQLFDQIEQRLRAEVDQVQDLLNGRQRAGVLPPDFEMPGDDDEVDN
jgi:hypothetical protein